MNLLCEVGPLIEHGDQNPFNLEIRVSLTADLADRFDQLRNALESEILALYGDQDAIGSDEGVDGQQIHRRRTINQNEIVIICNGAEQLAEPPLPPLHLGQLERETHQFAARGCQKQRFHFSRQKDGRNRFAKRQRMIRRVFVCIPTHSQSRGRVSLRIEIYKECAHFSRRQRRG